MDHCKNCKQPLTCDTAGCAEVQIGLMVTAAQRAAVRMHRLEEAARKASSALMAMRLAYGDKARPTAWQGRTNDMADAAMASIEAALKR